MGLSCKFGSKPMTFHVPRQRPEFATILLRKQIKGTVDLHFPAQAIPQEAETECDASLCLCCRAGQELGPSAALVPLKTGLSSLQSSLQSSSQVWGAVTQDLLQQLSQAALFQELCSGDLDSVPGLKTSSRLTCLMQLLAGEAAAPPRSSSASAGDPAAAAAVSVPEDVLLPASTAEASLKRLPSTDGCPGSNNGEAVVSSSPSGLSSTAPQPALTSTSNGQLEKAAVKKDEGLQATQSSTRGIDSTRRAVIFVGEEVTGHRCVACIRRQKRKDYTFRRQILQKAWSYTRLPHVACITVLIVCQQS